MQKCGGTSSTARLFPDDNSVLTQAEMIRYVPALKPSSDAVKNNLSAVQLQTLYNQHNEMASEVQDSRRRTSTGEEWFGKKTVRAHLAPSDRSKTTSSRQKEGDGRDLQ